MTYLHEVKEIVCVLMHVLDGGEVSRAELAGLSFAENRELRVALLEAYIKLLEFARDCELRAADAAADSAMRAALEACLDRIVEACDREQPPATPATATVH